MEAFLEILRICFEPMFFVALAGAIVCFWKKGDKLTNAFLGKFLAVSFFLMILWRIVYGINSTRYAAGLILPVIVFTVYLFANHDWLLLLPESKRKFSWRLLQTALVILVIVCFFKIYRINDKKAYFDSVVDKLKMYSKNFKYPVLIDFSKAGPRISYYSKIRRLYDGNLFNKPKKLKKLLLKGIKNSDVLFFSFPRNADVKAWEERIQQANTGIKLTKITEEGEKHSNIYYWVNNSKMLGEPVDASNIKANLNSEQGVLVEDFESPVKYEVVKRRDLAALKKRGAPFLKGDFFKFPAGWIINPAHGYKNLSGSELSIISGEDSDIIAGKYSLSTNITGYNGIYYPKGFSTKGIYSGEILFKGERGSRFRIRSYCYDKKGKFIGGGLYGEFYCLFPDQVRKARWDINHFSEKIDRFILVLEFGNGKLVLDNLIFRKEK